jgi:hypothetical protein
MLPEHPSWHKLDSTKINRYNECERAFFFEYVLGWKSEAPSNHLVFGDAWHRAVEHLIVNGYGDDQVVEAMSIFEATYREVFSADTDELFHPKDLFNAQKTLAVYAQHFDSDAEKEEVLYTEISGSAPIDDKRRIYFKIDAILRNLEENYVFVREHKTKGGAFNQVWASDWDLATQIGTYTHAAYCLYDMNEVKGVEVNGAAFIKSKAEGGKCDFLRVPCWRNVKQMENWLWVTNERFDQIYHDYERLAECSEDDALLYAFPMNPQNCTKWFRICDWHDYCLTWGNPLQHCAEPPLGFIQDYWDPEAKDTRHKMELDWRK